MAPLKLAVAAALAGGITLASPPVTVRAQATIDAANSYPAVGVLMVWRVDGEGRPVELRGFASGTLIDSRVMITAGHFTAPVTTLGAPPPSVRIFASFSPTDAKNPRTWIPAVGFATHASMPPCPPPPQCDPTDEILVAPLEPGIADVGLVLLAHAPPAVTPARLAAVGALARLEGRPTVIAGYGSTMPLRGHAGPIAEAWDGQRRTRISRLRKVVDDTWALWSIPSYVCSGDSGGGIFVDPDNNPATPPLLAANVSDGGTDCRRHNNNNRLDTGGIQKWIAAQSAVLTSRPRE